MKRSREEGTIRLVTGFLLNVLLWLPAWSMLCGSRYDLRVSPGLFRAAIAAAALVSLVPVFWRGEASQVAIAFVLLCLPVCVVRKVFRIAIDS